MDFSTFRIDPIQAKNPETIDFCMSYLEHFHTRKDVRSVLPFSFMIGSDVGMDRETKTENSLYWGKVTFDINPNLTPLVDSKLELSIHSLVSANSLQKPHIKKLTRYVEEQNYLNEATERFEFFSKLELTALSPAYDVYATFIGFKIDL